MSVNLPRNLFTQIFEDPNVNPASRRKVVLPRITRQIMEARGYTFGAKIRVPGGYAFKVIDPAGKKLKVGLKTAVNRWLNTAPTLVEMVDQVIVATFEWDEDDERPVAFELIEISASKLLAMITKVKDAAEARKLDRDGHYYMPLDKSSIEDDHVGCVAGAVIPAGNVLFGPESVNWVDDDWGSVAVGKQNPVARLLNEARSSSDAGSLVAQTKADLAARLGVPVENINLSITF